MIYHMSVILTDMCTYNVEEDDIDDIDDSDDSDDETGRIGCQLLIREPVCATTSSQCCLPV